MKTNIVLVGLIYDETKKIAEKLSKEFDLYYANIEDIIAYNLFNADEIKQNCGKKYLDGLKRQIIKEIGGYENTLICLKASLFLEKKNYINLQQHGTVVFLDYSISVFDKFIKLCEDANERKSLQVERLTFDEKSALCRENSDVIVEVNKRGFDKTYRSVKKIVEKYYL